MTSRLYDRLRRMTLAELAWRSRERAYTMLDRVRARVSTPEWGRPDRFESIAAAVIQRLQAQPARFVIDPLDADRLRDAVLAQWPDAAAAAAARADRILAGHYDLLGYRGLDFRRSDGSIDWHADPVHHRRAPATCWAEVPYLDPAVGDHKIIWELNRHQHWLQLGRAFWLTRDATYAKAIVDQCESWLAENPPLTGINWASMLEIGFRALSWTAAVHFLAAGSGQQAAGSMGASFLAAIDRQLTHLERHLSYYFSPNTHLTGEALALYVVGSAFPELPASDRWIATGRRILLDEIDRQILPDGGHAERSMHYQRYTLDFYLLALLTARRTGDSGSERTFTAAVSRLADFTLAIADDHGRLPLIGDDDGGMLWPLTGRECNDVRDSLAVAALVLGRPELARWGVPEEACWIAAREAVDDAARIPDPGFPIPGSRMSESRSFPATGYVVLRGSAGEHAVFDTGEHGYMNGGHAHADALALTLTVGDRPLLVDPGTSTYTMDPRLRDRMRSSFNHNTLAIDRRPQSMPAGPFHWRSAAAATLHGSRHNAGFDWVEAAHDGYAPLEHRRAILRANDAGWLVVDWVADRRSSIALAARDVERNRGSRHAISTHWHFHPNWMLQDDGHRRLRATHLDGGDMWLLFDDGDVSLEHGSEKTGVGWFAPVYGTLIPTWSARLTRIAVPPHAMVSWIGGVSAGVSPVLSRLDVAADSSSAAVAARVIAGDVVSTYLAHGAAPPACDERAAGIGDYQTNARILHVRSRGERLVALDLADASHALALRDAWITVAATEPVADLHLSIGDEILLLASTEPPRQLRLEGRALAGIRAVLLNGRSFLPPPMDHPDTLLVPGSAWGDHATARGGAPFATDAMRLNGCEEILPLRESSW